MSKNHRWANLRAKPGQALYACLLDRETYKAALKRGLLPCVSDNEVTSTGRVYEFDDLAALYAFSVLSGVVPSQSGAMACRLAEALRQDPTLDRAHIIFTHGRDPELRFGDLPGEGDPRPVTILRPQAWLRAIAARLADLAP